MGKILVIRGGALGDFILTLPAIRLLRESYPANEIEILGYPPIASLAVEAGLADSVRSIEYAAMAGLFIPGGTLDPELVAYFRGFDLVISYLYDPDGYFKDNLGRIGVRSLIEGIYKVDDDGAHAAFQLAATLEQLALFLDDPAPRLLDHSTDPKTRVALHPGSGSPRKNWETARWTETAVRLSRQFPDTEFLLVTGEAESETADTVAADWNARGLRFEHAHALPLWTLAEKLAQSALFLGHDTGIAHLAAACGVPSLLLFGPTNPAIWAPRNPAVTVLRAPDFRLKTLGVGEILSEAVTILETVRS